MSNAPENGGLDASVPGGRHTSHVGAPLPETERKVAVHDLQRERPDQYVALIDATQHDAKRQILHTLYLNGGVCLYEHLDETVNRHLRKIKKHVYALDDAGILTRSGNPTAVAFPDTDMALLVSDTLHLTDPL